MRGIRMQGDGKRSRALDLEHPPVATAHAQESAGDGRGDAVSGAADRNGGALEPDELA